MDTSQTAKLPTSSLVETAGTECSTRMYPVLPQEVHDLQVKLKTRYRVEPMDKFPRGLGDGEVRPTVENIHIKVVMLPKQELRREFDKDCDSHADIWRAEHTFSGATQRIKNVNLDDVMPKVKGAANKTSTFYVGAVASAGCGKTTVFTKIAPMRWAKDEIWGQFDIVVAREFRFPNVRSAECLSDLLGLKSIHGIRPEHAEVIVQYVYDYPHRVCLIIDGIDEGKLNTCSDFFDRVIHGRECSGLRLVITSRPCRSMFVLDDELHFNTRLEVVGFLPRDVPTYIRNVMGKDLADALIKKVDSNRQLLTMMCTPLLANEICRLFFHRQEVPRCVSDLFETMLLRIGGKTAGSRFKCWAEMPPHAQDMILKMGRYSFECLKSQEVVFELGNLKKAGVDEPTIEALGLLVQCDDCPGDPVRQFRFSHLALMENLAAKFHIHGKVGEALSPASITKLVEKLDPMAGHLRTFWVMLASHFDKDDKESIASLINALLTVGADSAVQQPGPTALEFPLSYLEPLCQRLKGPAIRRLAEQLLNQLVKGGGERYIVSKLQHHVSYNNEDFVKELLQTWYEEACSHSEDNGKEQLEEQLLAAVNNVDAGTALNLGDIATTAAKSLPIDHLDLRDPQCHPEARESHERWLLAFRCFAEYALHRDHAVEPVQSIIESLRLKRSVVIFDGRRNPAECRTTDIVVRHHREHVLSAKLRHFLDDDPCPFPSSLTTCCSIKRLVLEQFSGCHIAKLCAVLDQSSSTLHVLQIYHADIKEIHVEDLARSLKKCRKLEKLRVANADLSSTAAVMLAKSVVGATSLKAFELPQNKNIGDKALPQICSAFNGLGKLTNLKSVVFTNCGLTSSAVRVVTGALLSWTHLRRLSLDGNILSGLRKEDAIDFVRAVNDTTGPLKIGLGKSRKCPGLTYICENCRYREDVKIIL